MKSGSEKRKIFKKGENGSTLAITMLVMLVMCLIGAAALMTSSIDLKISGNAQVAKKVFYIADAAVNYVRVKPPISSWFAIIAGKANFSKDSASGISGDYSGTIGYQKMTNPPAGTGTGVRAGRGYHYLINCTGSGEYQARAQVEMQGYVIGLGPQP
jgi:hypothetical protein